ncbi:hypothetical protein SteCoe_4538 [Stentor coeruleus]|uniref:Uncharacterized protein n=1 Tax=Stentor coeruleus TaxID=5963 RepID=A0A1R2CUI0_9CILI|nr:hypothetical protein SteCoe_4538 [Stentor coeruleus]
MFRKTNEKDESSEGDSLREISLSNRLGTETEFIQYNISTLDYDDSSMPSNLSESESSAYLTKDEHSLKNSSPNDLFLKIDSQIIDDKNLSNPTKQFSNSENKTFDKEKLDIVKIYTMITNKNLGKYMNDNIKKEPLEEKNNLNKGNFYTEKNFSDDKLLDKDRVDFDVIKENYVLEGPEIQGKNFENKELYNTPTMIITECINEEDKSPKDDEKCLEPTQEEGKKPECRYKNFPLSKYAIRSSNNSQKDKSGHMSCAKCFII